MTHREALQLFKEVHAAFATPEEVAVSEETVTPAEEPLAPAESAPTTNYRQQLSDPLHTLSPAGFERFCQRLLRESGFEQVTITGRSGDGGIDGIGILQVSPLVSFKGLFQCKRYTSAVGSAQVRDFRGAMMGRADKGISLTTGTFTADAKREAIRDGVPPLAWVDGEKLVDRCEALELGLRPKTTFAFDPNCFDEFRQEKETGGRGHAESSGGASHMP
jgi:restriction system protein